MKKIKAFALLAALAAGALIFQTHAAGKKHGKSQVSAQFQQLIREHQKFIQAAYDNQAGEKVNASYNPAAYELEKDFFLYTSFLQDTSIQNFLHNVEADINQSGNAGYTMMSYTSISMVNGKSRSIQYTYQSNGKDITLVKQTSNNGTMLKSVYYYDIPSQSLKANDYRQNNIVHEKIYKI